MQLFLYCILFDENVSGLVKNKRFHSESLNLAKTLAKNVKGEKMVGFVKNFDFYHHKFKFGHFFSSAVKL